jgi:hypothetical protein
MPPAATRSQRVEAFRWTELQRLEPKLACLTPEARARVDEITHLIIEKLLLTPTEKLKAINDETMAVAYTDAVNRLFSLSDEAATARAGASGGAKPPGSDDNTPQTEAERKPTEKAS